MLHVLMSCIGTSSTIRSSLSVAVNEVTGFPDNGPRPYQAMLPAPLPLVLRPFPVGFCDDRLDRIDVKKDPNMGVRWFFISGKMRGRFVVTTATKVSRTAHDPAS